MSSNSEVFTTNLYIMSSIPAGTFNFYPFKKYLKRVLWFKLKLFFLFLNTFMIDFFFNCSLFPLSTVIGIYQALQVSCASYVISQISQSPFGLLRNFKIVKLDSYYVFQPIKISFMSTCFDAVCYWPVSNASFITLFLKATTFLTH